MTKNSVYVKIVYGMMRRNKHRNKNTRHNRQFLKNENNIFLSILKRMKRQRGTITVQQVAKDIKISRQAFYGHHQDINEAITECEKSLIREFKDFLNDNTHMFNKMDNNRRIITLCFLFMSQHRDIFYQICSNGTNQDALYQMLKVLYPKLQIKWLPANSAQVIDSEKMDVFFRLAVEIICYWGRREYCEFKKTQKYINQFLKLTERVSTITKVFS